MLKEKYYCVKQHDITDCGAACIATICKQYGLQMPISKIRQVAGTDKKGTNAYGLVKAAKALGFTAKGVKGEKEAIFSEFPLPAIAHVIINENILHYVVIHHVDKDKIIIADPDVGVVNYTPDDFFKIWTGVLILMVPTSTFKKGNETKSIYKRFFCLIKPQRRLLFNIFLASIIYTVLGILGAFYFKFLLDDILQYNLKKTLHVISVGVIILNLIKGILNAFRTHLLLYLSQRIDIPLILGYYEHVLDLPLNFFGTRRVGEIISRFMDASKIREAISGATLTIMIDTIMAIAGGIILYIQNSTLFFIAVIMLVLYCLIVFLFNKPINRVEREVMESSAQLNSYLIESLNGIETVKAFNAEEECKIKTEANFVRFLKKIFKSGKVMNYQSTLSGLIASIGGIVILWVGAYHVIKGNLSIGQLITFNSLLVYFVDPVKNLINLQPEMQTAIVASDRLGEILDLELEKDEDENRKLSPDRLDGDICFKNVDFRYGTRELVLKNINLNISKGERIALVGESGSGKTTLVKLILSLYKIEKGEILINDNNIKDININVLRDRIAYVPQNTFLFSGTIEENLKLGNDTTMEEIVQAAKLTKTHDFINNLPVRYKCRLEENGANLSGGQRQRISITRAILKKPDIMILDEATSNLDSLTEKAIEKTINGLNSNVTTIIIAHRLSTIKKCDKIYVLEKGEIIEVGSHEELIDKKGKYFNMWKEQLPEYDDCHHYATSSC
ncbi:peptidase domain-containing ABC transporter [Crassaminicella profunda]|uniref:peptidase domain-containing ABC transporter n=1 Tax=Crassaminicella profunda TaxID=1286698 RepID=UPI001CA681A8|nr:peptidase domain-containing ABC transporter [Crassaminicella profunda]QZY54911.1 peptidase domain-containing ABC transporter [Crassaminicella profunda]